MNSEVKIMSDVGCSRKCNIFAYVYGFTDFLFQKELCWAQLLAACIIIIIIVFLVINALIG